LESGNYAEIAKNFVLQMKNSNSSLVYLIIIVRFRRDKRIRTRISRIWSPVFFRLNYAEAKIWWRRRESNPRPGFLPYRLLQAYPFFCLGGSETSEGQDFCSAVPKLLFRRRDIQRKSEAIPLLDYLNIWRLLFVFCLLPDTRTSRRNPFVPYILYHIISMSTSVSPISCSSLNLNILTVLNAFSSSLYIIGLIFSPCASR
jgi:hypothetical protein